MPMDTCRPFSPKSILTCCEPGDLHDDVQPLLHQAALDGPRSLPQLLHHVEEDLEQHDGSGVVEQRLPLHQNHHLVKPTAW